MCRLIKKTGEEQEVSPTNGVTWSLQELVDLVGGHIEIHYIGGKQMVMHEEGKLQAEPIINPKATELWIEEYGPTDVIVGDVLLAEEESIV